MPKNSKLTETARRRVTKRGRKSESPNGGQLPSDKFNSSLKRYHDADGLKTGKHLPRMFDIGVVGELACCNVAINWSVVADNISHMFQRLLKESAQWQTLSDEKRGSVIDSIKPLSLAALTHLLPRLPIRFDLALNRLCFEAVNVVIQDSERDLEPVRRVGRADGRLMLREIVNILLDVEGRQIKRDLRIRRGPIARFRNQSQYKKVLQAAAMSVLREGKKLTMGNMIEELCKACDDARLDESTIKRWNDEYDVNWKAFKKEITSNHKVAYRVEKSSVI